MERLQRMFGAGAAGLGAGAPTDGPLTDNAEQVYISSLALLKMLKHGRAGVPMEVMGLMLGEFVDEYTVRVIDVFAMPQSGTGVSVEAVDPVFQTKMLDMLKQTGRPEMVVGWYHSHPGFGCWLSGVDINCFPVEDHQILTERGFMFYHEVMDHFKTHDTLRIASYIDGRLVYQPITVNEVSHHSGEHHIVNIKGDRNHVDLRPTDNHNMWVRVGPTGSKGQWLGTPKAQQHVGPPFCFLKARELVAMGQADARTSVRFTAQFEAGIDGNGNDTGLALPFAASLDLHTSAQVDAFLWLYGYWLGDGWLDGSARCAYVCFDPVKLHDVEKLDTHLSRVGLPRLASATVGAHGYWRSDGPNVNGQYTFRICAASWWEFFTSEYGGKYATMRQLEVDHGVAKENVKSAKWMCSWVLERLNKRQLRILLSGLHVADGAEAAVCTSSASFRDEILHAAIHAGYTANFELGTERGSYCGTNSRGVPIIARHHHWRVRYHDYPHEAQPRVSASSCTVQPESGAVWCVTVPSPHLIMVRRVLAMEDSVVTAASRPVIVGNTQQSFEALNQRAVAVVVDPIQSVKGKVVIDAFRLINTQLLLLGQEPRQTTSNLGHLNKPSIQALIHSLNRHYYSIAINYRKNELEQKMLLNLHKKKWTEGLRLEDFAEQEKANEKVIEEMLELAKTYNKWVREEDKVSAEKLVVQNVGKLDPKRHLEEDVNKLMSSNIVQSLGTMIDSIVF